MRTISRLGSGVALALALAACGPDDAEQSKLANVEWPFDSYGIDSGWPGGAGLPPLPDAEPMTDEASRGPRLGYAAYGQGGDDGYPYGYAPAYFDDAYGQEPEDAYWEDDGPNGNSYALIALAGVLGAVLADSPPDYGFAYDGVQPWAWETGDRYRRYAEPIPGGWRTYYYAPESDSPFLVQDPYYSYGYRENHVVVIYDRGGRLIDPGRAGRQRRVADRYYDRGSELYRASRSGERRGVAAPAWASRGPRFVDYQRDWERTRDRQQGWQAWERRHGDVITARWSQERAVRQYAANRFDRWRKQDFKGAAPRFYQEAGRDPQLRRAVLAQQASVYRQSRGGRPDQEARIDRSRQSNDAREQRRDLVLAERVAQRGPDRQMPDRRQIAEQQRQQIRQERAQAQQRRQQERASRLGEQRQRAMERRQVQRDASDVGQRQQVREQAHQQRQSRATQQRQQAQASQARQQQAQQRNEQRQAEMQQRRQQAQQQRQAQASQARQQQARQRNEQRQAEMQQRRQQAQQQRQAQASQAREQQARQRNEQRQAEMQQRRQQAQQQRQAQASQARQQQARQRQVQMQQQRQHQAAAQQAQRGPGGDGGGERRGGRGHDKP